MGRSCVVRSFVLIACVLAFACDDDPESHVYVAAPFDAVHECFGPSAPLAQIDTADGDLDCTPTCLVALVSTAANAVYVSSMCGPFPVGYDASQTNPTCSAALAAWPAESAALADGTSSCDDPGSVIADSGAPAEVGRAED